MCTEVFFPREGRTASSIADLADVLGGFDKLVFRRGYGGRKAFIAKQDTCLCPVDIERTMKPTDYILTTWVDGCDYTARKPEWIVEHERHAAEQVKYDAAIAEMRAQAGEAGTAKTQSGLVHEHAVAEGHAPQGPDRHTKADSV